MAVSAVKIDPVEQQGFDDQTWNETQKDKPIEGYRANPHPAGTDEYYRWNRGALKVIGQ